MRIDHVGIAVESLEKAIPIFEALLGRAATDREQVSEQSVRVAVFPLEGARLELLEATAPDSPVAKFIARRGPGIHHLTFAVPNLDAALAELYGKGIQVVDRTPRTGAGNARVAFLHPKSTAGVLIELVENPGENGKP
jgi:methylmalonyl-CoA/ethylmalonyl-CoA epimerase